MGADSGLLVGGGTPILWAFVVKGGARHWSCYVREAAARMAVRPHSAVGSVYGVAPVHHGRFTSTVGCKDRSEGVWGGIRMAETQ